MVNRAQKREAARAGRPIPGPVVMAWLHPGDVAGGFADSVAHTLINDAQGPRRLTGPGGGLKSMGSSPRVAEARSQIVEAFLTRPEFTPARWLFFVDADMTWREDALERMIASAEQHKAEVMGGLCFAGGRSSGRIYPTIYELHQSDAGVPYVQPIHDYPRDAVVKVGGTGGAFLLIRRELLLAMADDHPRGFGTRPDGSPNPYPWFVEGLVDVEGRPLGEDIAFMLKAQMLGAGVYVDTSIKVGHVKKYQLTEELFDLSRDLQGPSPLAEASVGDHADHGG
jgi:hypothetical protein